MKGVVRVELLDLLHDAGTVPNRLVERRGRSHERNGKYMSLDNRWRLSGTINMICMGC